jgi:hypothetical protein
MDTPLWPAGSPPAPWMSLQEMVAKGVVPSSGELVALLQQLGALTSATLIQTGQGLTGGPITGAAEIRLADIPPKHVLANMGGVASAPVPTTVDGLGWVRSEREVRAGTGLEGGGDLEEDRELRLRAIDPSGTGPRPIVDAFGRVTELRPLQTDDVVQPLGAPPTYGPATIADLRAYQGPASAAFLRSIALLHDGLGGNFAVDPADESTADDGKNVIVDGRDRRWKRISPGWVSSRLNAALRSLEEKLSEVELSVEDFRLAIDADDLNSINRAIAAVPADGGTVVFNRALDREYLISGPIVLGRGNISLRGKHHGVVQLTSTSATANHMTIGAVSAAYLFNVHIHKFTFKRSGVASAGWAIDVTNTGYSTFERLRVFGDNKQYQGFRFRSCNSLYLSRIRTENIQKEAGWFEGLGAAAAVMDGNVINVYVEDWYNSGCHGGSTSLETQGVIVFKDYVEGVWLDEIASDSHKGYVLFFDGTLANRPRNKLIHITSLDVESGQVGAGALRARGYTAIWVDTEWVSGKDLNTVHIDQSCTDFFWQRGDIGIGFSATEAAAFYVDGQAVRCGARLVGYSTNAHGTGLQIGPNADFIDWQGGGLDQLKTGLDVHPSSRTGKKIALCGTRFMPTLGTPASFDLNATAHDLHLDCPGIPICLRGNLNLGGSAISAPLKVVADNSYVNGVTVFGAVANSTPEIAATGLSATIGLTLQTKGLGNLNFKAQGGAKQNMELIGADPGAGTTVIYVRYHNGSMEKYENVSIGDVNTAGTGYRALRLPN